MKLTYLSKTARTLTLTTLLSIMVGTSVQQSAQAQAPSAINPALKIACVPLAKGEFAWAFKGIDLSPQDVAAYDKLEKAFSKKLAELDRDVPKEVLLNQPPAVWFKGQVSEALSKEIMAAYDTMLRDNVPFPKMAELLTKKYGQHAEFPLNERGLFTPEQIAVWDGVEREYFEQIASAFPPAKQKLFRANIIRQQQIGACDGPRLTLDPAYQNKTIVDIAVSNPKFSTLVQAVKVAGLTETLSSKTQSTVFAPTNKAFAALPKGTLEKLLKPENRETLRKLLTYHVVPGAAESQILQSGVAKSIAGSPINVQVSNSQIKVNNATVILADVKTSNGIIHVIDQVILPPDLKL
jgi:uncharacterized surface protein with fasciclin (FAS1) repeats